MVCCCRSGHGLLPDYDQGVSVWDGTEWWACSGLPQATPSVDSIVRHCLSMEPFAASIIHRVMNSLFFSVNAGYNSRGWFFKRSNEYSCMVRVNSSPVALYAWTDLAWNLQWFIGLRTERNKFHYLIEYCRRLWTGAYILYRRVFVANSVVIRDCNSEIGQIQGAAYCVGQWNTMLMSTEDPISISSIIMNRRRHR